VKPEDGATLILALAFLVVMSLIIVSLVGWAGNNLRDTVAFKAAQNSQSAANSATEVAIEDVRYNFDKQTINPLSPVPCWTSSGTPSQLTANGETVSTWCSTLWLPGKRYVTIATCLGTSSCASAPFLQVEVTMTDYDLNTGFSSCNPGAASSGSTTCGKAETLDSWVFEPQVPIVVGVADGPTCSGTLVSVQITGKNLSDASNVDFFSNANLNNEKPIQVAPQSATANSIAVCPTSGTLASGSTYYAAVETPTGITALGVTFKY
jgi:Tfp pilus assembly protein PilX/predicted metal-binding protein